VKKALKLIALTAAAVAVVASFTAGGAIARGAAPPQFGAIPTIEGTPIVGNTLTATNGTWTGNPTSFRYQWDRCDLAGDRQNCGPISGATSKSYKLVNADADHQVRVRVTACNADGCTTKDSKGVIVSANTAPSLVSPPTISGTPAVGETLHANHGTWTANPTSYGYDWLRCDQNGNSCSSTGSRGTDYGVRSADVDHSIRVKVTARNAKGSRSAISDQTAVVTTAGGGGGGGGGTAVPVSSVSLPNQLVVSGLQFSPNPGTHAPITARFKVSDARGRAISGALVYVIGLPYGWIRNAPEQATDGTGVATITLVPTAAMPRTASLVMFVRARKPGENLLAGVSTRRLVQLRIRG
jgi:hypothetical protein